MNDALAYIAQGLANGVPQGMRLGYLGQEMRQRQQQIETAKIAAQAEAEREKMKMTIDKGKMILDGWKEAPTKLKPDYYKAWANFSNENFGTSFDPLGYDANADEDLDGLIQLVNMRQKNKISDDDFFFGASKFMASLDEKQQARAAKVIQPLIDLTRIKNQGRATAGDVPLGEFATRKVLKLSGMSDKDIDEGQKAGVIPRRLKRAEAQLIIPRGINFNFGSLGQPASPGNSLTADTVANQFGFGEGE